MVSAVAKLGERDLLRELIPVRAYAPEPEDQVYLLDGGGLGFGFLCVPLTGADTSAADRLNVLLTQDWPKDAMMQVGLWAGPDIEADLDWMMRLRGLPPKEREMTPPETTIAARQAFLRERSDKALIEGSGVRVRDIRCFITVSLPGDGETEPREKLMNRARELRKALLQTLKTAGMAPQPLSPERYIRLMQTLTNPNQSASWRGEVKATWDGNTEIRDQLFDYNKALDVTPGGLLIGDPDNDPDDQVHITMMSVKRFPRRVGFGMALSYLGDVVQGARGIRETMLVTATMVFGDPERTQQHLETQRQWVTQQAYGPLLKFNPKLGDKKESYDALFEALNEGDRPVKLYLGVALYTRPEDTPEAVSNARTYYREVGFTLMRDRFIALPLFLTCLPLCADAGSVKTLMRFRTMATRHAISLLPLFSDWKGNGRPMLNFVSRNGQIMNYDLFYDGGGNYNALVCAQSGSGKSVLMNEIISSYLSAGARAWVIDVGRSYKKLCEHFGGQFIQFSDDADICLNPFPIVNDIDDESEVLSGIFEAMAAPHEGFTDFQRSQVQKILKSLWDEKENAATIDDLETLLLAHEDKRVNDIGHQLFPFTSRGAYGHFFSGANNVRFDDNLVVLELEELKTRQHLQQVVLFMLIYQIQQGMFLSAPDREKLLMVDEGWDLLTSGNTGKFMENSYRRVRKNRGSAIIATQGLQDLDASSGGRAIKENSASTMLLGMKPETVQALREAKAIDLTEFGFSVLKTVHTQPGAYAEVFISTAVGSGIGRLVLEPFKQLLYSTKPADLEAIERYHAQGMSLFDSITAVLRDREAERQ